MASPPEKTSPNPSDAEPFRPRLFGIAYRMLGDVQDANDVVQETFLRWHQNDRTNIGTPEAWLVAVASRLSIDRLRRAATERAAYVGHWLPAPLATADHDSPDYASELASDLSMALLVILERLSPEERAAFLLRDVFDTPYEEIARIIDKSEPATRQLIHRARTRVRTERTRFNATREAHERMLHKFLDALHSENKDEMLALFSDDATFTSDGGGKVSAARNIVAGPDRITRLLLGWQRKGAALTTYRLARLNGETAIVTYAGDRVYAVTAVQTDGEHITAIYRVLNPDKLISLQ